MSDETGGLPTKPPQNGSAAAGHNIPKEQLTAYQRWELASFDPNPKFRTTPAETEAAALMAAAKSEAGELQRIRQQAYDEGFAAGQQAGSAAGMQQARIEAAKMQALLQNLQVALNQLDEQLAQSLLDLSLEIAHKMVLEVLQIKPEIILKIISTAISSLPHFNQNAHLVLHPNDADLVRKLMGEQLAHAGWKIFTDAQIETGGCRIETAHSNIDATNPSRWQCIVGSIGQDKSWLA